MQQSPPAPFILTFDTEMWRIWDGTNTKRHITAAHVGAADVQRTGNKESAHNSHHTPTLRGVVFKLILFCFPILCPAPSSSSQVP